ncbi:uncharacterized protein LOC135817121 [Sycon ciliatum]|uniref:uncharacterized protein LOC135817121 n=1 Tax=Sycon ciliatum TaxID=27933 RepID=UPI0031F71503
MALRSLRLAKLGGIGQAAMGRPSIGPSVSPRIVEPVSVPRRYLRQNNPDDTNIFGTTWQSEKYRVPHPRRLGIIPFMRPLQFLIFVAVGAAASIHWFKRRFDSYANYDLPELFANHTEEIEKRQAIRDSGWQPPSYPTRPGMLSYHYHRHNPDAFSDDPLIPSAPLARDPQVRQEKELGGYAWAKPIHNGNAFLDMFFPEHFHKAFYFDQMEGWDRYVSRDMMKEYHTEMEQLQGLHSIAC